MQPTSTLTGLPPDLRLRIQAPALTVGSIHSPATTVTTADVIRWTAQAGGVRLDATCQRHADGEWRMTFSLRNEGADVEVRFAYPYLFYHFELAQPVRIFNPTFGGILESSITPICQDYPGPATFCLTAAAGNTFTLAAGLFNAQQRHIVIRHIPAGQDGQIRFVCERVLVRRGMNVQLPEKFLRVGSDWADAFAPYRAFAETAFPRRRERPQWLTNGNFTETRKAHCIAPVHPPEAVAGIWIFDDQGQPRSLEFLKAEVDEAFADGAAKGYTPLFYQFGWWQSMTTLRGLFMFDSVCGDYTAAHAVTRDIIAYIHARGGRTYLYTNAISLGDESDTFRQRPGLLARDAAGFPMQNSGYPMYMICPGSPEARAYWDEILRFVLIELDADGIFLDQVGGGFASCYCYAKDHHHEHPDRYGTDFIELVDFIGSRARELKPDSLIAGELVLDARSPLLDETHGVGYSHITAKPPETVELRAATKPAEYYIFTKYLTPQIHSSVHLRGHVMNGAAGSHAWEEWRQYREILSSTVTTCVTEPAGALAYLFGPIAGRAVLVVRTHGEARQIRVHLPVGMKACEPSSAAIANADDGWVSLKASVEPCYVAITADKVADVPLSK